MPRYALLVLPNANRVYGHAAPALAMAELEVVLGGAVDDVHEEDIAGIPYVLFATLDAMDHRALAELATLSSAFALFQREGDALRPLALPQSAVFDDDLITIQRYPGKTNEAFTALLVNVTRAAATIAAGQQVRLLDPVCGRGTTLNQGLLLGWRVGGVEIDAKSVDAYEQFLTTWLQDKRIKHDVARGRIRRDGKVVGRRVDIAIGSSKAEVEAGGATSATVVNDDTRFTATHFPKRSFDVIVGDLPYGVQHGSRAGERSRSPMALVHAALEGWVGVLRPGGAIGLAFNTKVVPRAEMVEALSGTGLDVMDGGPWLRFEHRVDRSIQRDLIVARA